MEVETKLIPAKAWPGDSVLYFHIEAKIKSIEIFRSHIEYSIYWVDDDENVRMLNIEDHEFEVVEKYTEINKEGEDNGSK